MLEPLTFHPEVLELWSKALKDYDSLPENERLQMHFLFSRFFRWNEQQHLQLSRGNYDASFFESMVLRFSEFLTYPGIQQWWLRNRDVFESKFRTFVEARLDENRLRGRSDPPNLERDD